MNAIVIVLAKVKLQFILLDVRIARVLITGFFLATLCPMTMGAAMPMQSLHVAQQHHLEHVHEHEQHSAVPCEQCEKEHQQVAAFFSPIGEKMTARSAAFFVSDKEDFARKYENSIVGGISPPDPPASLVGTVILRT